MNIAVCPICQQEFKKRRGEQIYCSSQCYHVSHSLPDAQERRRLRGRERKRQLRAEDPERLRAASRKSREKYREQYNERNREWRKQHPEYIREHSRRWRAEHPGYKKQEYARYYPTHKDVVAAKVERRRARIRNAEGTWTAEQFKELCKQVDYYCAYCHGKFDKLTPEHIIPLSRGGSNDISNIIPACRSCNNSKHDKTPLEYLIGFKF